MPVNAERDAERLGLSNAAGQLDSQRRERRRFLSGGKVSAKVCRAMPPLGSELTEVFQLWAVKLRMNKELLEGCR